jgi:hypothetical protein
MNVDAWPFCKLRSVLAISFFLAAAVPAQSNQLEEGRAAIGAGDYVKAMELLRPLADSGDAVAQNAMGVLYLQGWGVANNPERAFGYFQLSAAQGNAKGVMNLAHAYRTGTGVEPSCVEARKLLEPLAQSGNATAQATLGMIYDTGCSDNPVDPQAAFHWYSAAAAQGDPIGLGNLGSMYALGLGVEQDYAEAMNYYRRAAELGNGKAATNLGRMFELGEGTPRDLQQAKHWYREAAASGEAEAEQRLAALEDDENAGNAMDTDLLAGALKAPPHELAQSYASISTILEMLPLAEAGVTLKLPDGEVNKDNAAAVKNELEQRLAIYERAIAQRGSADISGEYVAEAPKCSYSGSAWASLIAGGYDHVFVTQDGAKVAFEASKKRRRNKPEFTASGFCVENSISLIDPMNSDYVLTIKPDVESILQAWPDFIKPPSRVNLSSCSVRLRHVDSPRKTLPGDDSTTFAPTAGKGALFIHRANKFGASEMIFRLKVNDHPIGPMAPNEYYRLDLEPGEYVVTVRSRDITGAQSTGKLEIELEPDQLNFIEIKPKMGWKALKLIVEEVPVEVGRRLVLDGKALN